MEHRTLSFRSILPLVLLTCPMVVGRAHAQGFEKAVRAEPFMDGLANVSQVRQNTGRALVVTNATIDPANGADMLLQVVDGQGEVLYDRVIGGPDYHDICKEVVQVDDAYYLAGYTRGIDASDAHTFTAFVIKVDPALNIVRQTNYILPGQEIYANAITVTQDKRLLIAGQVYDGSDLHTCVMKTDTAGNVLWLKQYALANSEVVRCIRELGGGDILLSGSIGLGFELSVPLAFKLGPTGNLKWGRYYNYPPVAPVERSSFDFIRATSVSDVLLAGHTDAKGAGGQDFYLAHIDTSGTPQEVFTYGGPQFEEPYGIDYDQSVGVLMFQGASGSFAPDFQPRGISMRIATQGSLLGATLYGDPALQQPIELYQYTRLDAACGLLSGVRPFPANDVYLTRITGSGASCNATAVTATAMQDTTTTGSFTATVTTLTPQVNTLELGTYTYTNDTLLCRQIVGVEDAAARPHLGIHPNPGEGTFQLDLPAGYRPVTWEVHDAVGRLLYRSRTTTGPITLPDDLPSGLFLIVLRDATGTPLTARYERQ